MRSLLISLTLLAAARLPAQEKPALPGQEPDVLLLNNGERLVGHFESATAAAISFKSETAGVVSIHWDKVKELQASGAYAVIPKSVRVTGRQAIASVPKGSVSMVGKTLRVTPAPGATPREVPIADTAFVVAQPDFDKVSAPHSIFGDWQGGVTGGFSLVQATQSARGYNAGVSLARKEPDASWVEMRSRTLIDVNVSYAKVTQPHSPDIKTEIYHGGLEQDVYFSPRGFGFGQLAFDHNFSQGLDLQQLYGGGVGVTVVKRENQQLDLKISADYIRQSFSEAANNKNLIGSQFSDTYLRKLPRGIVFTQALTFTPSWNNTSAFAAIGGATVIFPTYKRLSVNLGVSDSYLHDPAPGFRKNSFQSTAGIAYSLR